MYDSTPIATPVMVKTRVTSPVPPTAATQMMTAFIVDVIVIPPERNK